MRRLVAALVSSPVLIVADIGITCGIALMVLGALGKSTAGSPIFVGLMLIGLSLWLMVARLVSAVSRPSGPPPSGGRLPPAQEGIMDVKTVEREKVAAVGGRGPVAVA